MYGNDAWQKLITTAIPRGGLIQFAYIMDLSGCATHLAGDSIIGLAGFA
jgi:hypothetical protein